jgi:hypothetical protein
MAEKWAPGRARSGAGQRHGSIVAPSAGGILRVKSRERAEFSSYLVAHIAVLQQKSSI